MLRCRLFVLKTARYKTEYPAYFSGRFSEKHALSTPSPTSLSLLCTHTHTHTAPVLYVTLDHHTRSFLTYEASKHSFCVCVCVCLWCSLYLVKGGGVQGPPINRLQVNSHLPPYAEDDWCRQAVVCAALFLF